MSPRNNVLLFLCTDCYSVALFLCSPVPPFLCSSIPPFLRSSVPLFLYSSVPLFLCSSVPLLLYSSIPLFLCSSVPLFLCSYVALLLCSSVPLFVPPFVCSPVTLFFCAYSVNFCSYRKKEYYTDNVKPYSICFTTIKKIVRFFKAWPRAWQIELEQRCLNSCRQRQISQPHCDWTFAPIVSAHPYRARLRAQILMPRHASSARAKY